MREKYTEQLLLSRPLIFEINLLGFYPISNTELLIERQKTNSLREDFEIPPPDFCDCM